MAGIPEILRTYGPEYIQNHPQIPQNHRKVIKAITRCKTGELGQTVYQCQGCAKLHILDCSCGNRHCPQCQYIKSQNWLKKHQERLLSVPSFMITFTVPEQVRDFIRSHQRTGYQAMFQASSEALKLLAKDQKFIGTNLPGFTGILHTWGRQLTYHPHIHYIVPGGGLAPDRTKWLPSHPGFYAPVKALSRIYKAKFKERIKDAGMLQDIDPIVWSMDWNVNSQAVGDGKTALTYLGPYVFKVAIGNSRIVKVEDRNVTFTYIKKGSRRTRTMTLEVIEFIRRFLQHVLPDGFMKVRHYGFMHPSCRTTIEEIKPLLPNLEQQSDDEQGSINTPNLSIYCSDCGDFLVFVVRIGAPPTVCDSS